MTIRANRRTDETFDNILGIVIHAEERSRERKGSLAVAAENSRVRAAGASVSGFQLELWSKSKYSFAKKRLVETNHE